MIGIIKEIWALGRHIKRTKFMAVVRYYENRQVQVPFEGLVPIIESVEEFVDPTRLGVQKKVQDFIDASVKNDATCVIYYTIYRRDALFGDYEVQSRGHYDADFIHPSVAA